MIRFFNIVYIVRVGLEASEPRFLCKVLASQSREKMCVVTQQQNYIYCDFMHMHARHCILKVSTFCVHMKVKHNNAELTVLHCVCHYVNTEQ